MKHLWVLAVLLTGFSSLGQTVNDYKYVIVPDRYTWAKQADQYQINSLTKFLFNKYGFDASLLTDASLPLDLNRGGCNTMYANVEEDSNLFSTRLKVILSDCVGEVIYASEQGKSKEKDYKKESNNQEKSR